MLGRGVSAKVKIAIREGRAVAVKNFFGRGLSFIPDEFILEAAILTKLNHPYVMSFLGVEIDWQKECCRLFLPLGVMNLKELVESGEDYDRRLLGEQITLGLIYLQNMDILHGDLKPENVIIMEDLTPRLADFGFAVLNAGTYAQVKRDVNTFRYKPPEVLLGSGCDFSLYSWGLGLLLYFMERGKEMLRLKSTMCDLLREIFTRLGGSKHWSEQELRSFILYDIPPTLFLDEGDRPPLVADSTLNDLLTFTIHVDPRRRLSLCSVLDHPYFARRGVARKVSPLDALLANETAVTTNALVAEILDRNQLVPYTEECSGLFAATVQICSRFLERREDVPEGQLVLACLRLACALREEDFTSLLEESEETDEELEEKLQIPRFFSQHWLDELTVLILKELNYDLWFTTIIDYARLEGSDLLEARDALM